MARHGFLSVIVAGAFAGTAFAQFQIPSNPVDLPNGPAKPGFDITRFRNSGNGWFETFYVTKTEALQSVLAAGRVAEDARVLVTETKTGRLALLMDQMAYHHIAQGSAGGKDWMATF